MSTTAAIPSEFKLDHPYNMDDGFRDKGEPDMASNEQHSEDLTHLNDDFGPDAHEVRVDTHTLATQAQQRSFGAFDVDSLEVEDYSREPSSNHSMAPWSTSIAVSFPDVSSYQQPYFYQQTDPSIYNSPWPPPDPSGGASSNAIAYSSSDNPNSLFSSESQDPSHSFLHSSFTTPPTTTSDFSSAFANYDETNDHHDLSKTGASHLVEDASVHLKLQSLPILDNLATQLIHTITKASYSTIQDLMHGTDSEESQAYSTLKSLFDQTRKVYVRDSPFIDAIATQLFQPAQQEIIRKANIATFISSVLGAHDVSFFHLNEYFMETFVPLGHRLLKWQGALYLELKTQTYISALMNSDGSREDMLHELFPRDMDSQILARHPDAPALSPSEQDFIDRSRARKSYLLAEPGTEEGMRELPKKYQWSDFVREFALCISKNVDSIVNVPSRSSNGPGASNTATRQTMQNSIKELPFGTQPTAATLDITPLQSTSENGESTKKASAVVSSVRQPWSKAEEDALVSGLEKVNGPHWSQILALYGRGGSLSEILKDRNQVQLKDKARNLKLWYLKMGKEVPVALRGVTGELRKRGGARARAALEMLEDNERNRNSDGAGEIDADERSNYSGTQTAGKKRARS